MKVDELKIGSKHYKEALELRYELFFQKHDLPKNILFDEHENASRHIAIICNASLIAYGRLTNLSEGTYQLSQIVVKPQEQRKGYGTIILKKLVEFAENNGGEKVILNARTTATELYKKQGFKNTGEEFLSKSTGVPHVQMLYTPNNKTKE